MKGKALKIYNRHTKKIDMQGLFEIPGLLAPMKNEVKKTDAVNLHPDSVREEINEVNRQ